MKDIKIWLITGEIAERSLDAILSRFEGVEKIIAPVSVASFITKQMTRELINSRPEMKNGIIILPGMIRWNIEGLPEEMDVYLVKGPKNLNDLPRFLKRLKKLAGEKPSISKKDIIERLKKEKSSGEEMGILYGKVIGERRAIFKGELAGAIQQEENKDLADAFHRPFRNFQVPSTGVIIGKDFPPVVMAEIINAPEKDRADILSKIEYFLRNGAEIIDMGSTPGKANPRRMGEIINEVVEKFKCPVSVDTLDEKEIISGVENGAKIVLSIDQGNKEVLDSLDKEIGLVIIPTNIKEGYLPLKPDERVSIVKNLIAFAQERGFSRIMADPILNSPVVPGLVPSLEAFIQFFHEGEVDANLDLPLFIGGSNVSEMIDTGSTGVNALLAILGVELGAGVLFTTEDSMKCLGSVKEMASARDLAFQAKLKNTFPKDLSFNAFNFKQKQKTVPLFEVEEGEQKFVDLTVQGYKDSYKADPSGLFFKIMVDHLSGTLLAGVFDKSGMVTLFKGTNAEIMGKRILDAFQGLSPDHLLYLGRELSRAELCLKYNSAYIQDEQPIR